MSEPTSQQTIQDYDQQKAALEQQRLAVEDIERKESFPALRDRLMAEDVTALLNDLAALLPLFSSTSDGVSQIRNIEQCINSSRSFVSRKATLLAAPADA